MALSWGEKDLTPRFGKLSDLNGSDNWTGNLRNWMLTFCSLSLLVGLGTSQWLHEKREGELVHFEFA